VQKESEMGIMGMVGGIEGERGREEEGLVTSVADGRD